MRYYGDRLKYIREEHDLSQYEISELMGFKKRVYGNFEREETIIPLKHLNFLCNYFNVSLDYIFKFTEEKNYKNIKKEINKSLIKKRLKEVRLEYNLTQKKLADILHISPSTISEYEREAKLIATPFLYDICKKYNISADYLLGKIDHPKYLE